MGSDNFEYVGYVPRDDRRYKTFAEYDAGIAAHEKTIAHQRDEIAQLHLEMKFIRTCLEKLLGWMR